MRGAACVHNWNMLEHMLDGADVAACYIVADGLDRIMLPLVLYQLSVLGN
jgi:hypothetical protein